MAPKNRDAGQAPDATAQEATQQQHDPQLPPTRPPQGIVIDWAGNTVGFMHTGDPKKDFIGKFRRPRIDAACLVVEGHDPYLALPMEGNPGSVRIRQVGALDAADMLSCDKTTGVVPGPYRLATDLEIERHLEETKKRIAVEDAARERARERRRF
jgi:hypothetical protein